MKLLQLLVSLIVAENVLINILEQETRRNHIEVGVVFYIL